jgi:release factor glutamine methyltransferase
VAEQQGDQGDAQVTIGALLLELTQLLTGAGRDVNEARDIVAAVLDVPRLWPTTHLDALVDASAANEAREAARRLLRGAPFAYAVGRSAFRYLTIAVDERVLIPRAETEVLVDLVLEGMRSSPGGIVVDVGTGSGAIALALASEGDFDLVIASDVSLDALAVAGANARLVAGDLRAPIEFVHGVALAPFAGRHLRARVIVSNPPYIAHAERDDLPTAVRDWEPPVALFADDDGLAVTRSIIRGAPEVLEPGGLLALEVDARRARRVAAMLEGSGRFRGVTVRDDLTGRERFVLGRLASEAS